MKSETIIAMALVAGLAACSESGTFNEEAGGDLSPGIGAAVNGNEQAMTAPRDTVINLTRQFAAQAPTTVNFAFNSAVLDGAAQQALAAQAAWIRKYPDITFRVYGYTDLVGSNAYNQALGMRRAQAVVSFLSAQGISKSRLQAVVSYGKTQPLVFVPGPNERNRRAVTEVSGFVRSGSTGTPMDGKYAMTIYQEYVKSATATAQNTVQGQTSAGNTSSN